MVAFYFYIVRLFFAFQFPAELKETEAFNTAMVSMVKEGRCEEAVKSFYDDSTSGIRIYPSTRLKFSECLSKLDMKEELGSELNYLKSTRNAGLLSRVLNQEALLMASKGDTLTAINQLKKAIEIENNNTFAKYNFEYLSKVYKPNRNQPPSSNSSNAEQKKDNDGGIIDYNTEGTDELESNLPTDIDLAQALQLLDAMRANEFNTIPLINQKKKDTVQYGKW